jgi:hypothetical protein
VPGDTNAGGSMTSGAHGKTDVGEQVHVYRNRTAACLVSCRCRDVGETGQCEPTEKPFAASGHSKRHSIFGFCKSSLHRPDLDQPIL